MTDNISDNILPDNIDDDIEEVQESTESGPGQYEHWRMTVDAGQQPVRIDKFLAEHMQHSSRNRIQTAAEAGCIQVNGKPVKMRQYPSTSCATWDQLSVGTEVTIVEPGETWAKINSGRREGWYMMAKFLDVVGDGKGKY